MKSNWLQATCWECLKPDSIPRFLPHLQLGELLDIGSLNPVLMLSHKSLRFIVPDNCPVASLEVLRYGVDGHIFLLRADVLLTCLEVRPGDLLQPILVILTNLRSLNIWLSPLVSRYDHVPLGYRHAWSPTTFLFFLLKLLTLQPLIARALVHSLHLGFFEVMISLVLHDHLFDPARRVSVHEDALARFAHLEHLVLVHRAKDKLLSWHVYDELLGLDHVEHLTNLILAKCIDKVDLVEVDKNCVLASLGERAGYLTLVHLHQTLDHTVVLARKHGTQRVDHILLVRSLLIVHFGSGHEVGPLNGHFLVEFDFALLDDEELSQREVILR